MTLTGIIKNASPAFGRGGELLLHINELSDLSSCYEQMRECEKLSIEIKPYRKKRSLNANAYAWVLIDKIAQKTGYTKEEVYREAIRNIGGISDVVCIQNKAVESFCKNWQSKGIGWQTEVLDSKIKGCTNVVVYYGSSVYNTEQMSQLVDTVCQDAKALGIQTETPLELARMKEAWGG